MLLALISAGSSFAEYMVSDLGCVHHVCVLIALSVFSYVCTTEVCVVSVVVFLQSVFAACVCLCVCVCVCVCVYVDVYSCCGDYDD